MKAIRLNVLGASGSGTSTVGRALASKLSIPHFECDDYFHGPSDPPFQNPRSARERAELIERDLQHAPSWVLSGGIAGWEPEPRLEFTHIVFLYVPVKLRLERLRQRESERFGERIEPEGDMFQIHQDFLEWSSRYDAGDVEGKTLAVHTAYLAEQTCPVYEFGGEKSVNDIVEATLELLNENRPTGPAVG